MPHWCQSCAQCTLISSTNSCPTRKLSSMLIVDMLVTGWSSTTTPIAARQQTWSLWIGGLWMGTTGRRFLPKAIARCRICLSELHSQAGYPQAPDMHFTSAQTLAKPTHKDFRQIMREICKLYIGSRGNRCTVPFSCAKYTHICTKCQGGHPLSHCWKGHPTLLKEITIDDEWVPTLNSNVNNHFMQHDCILCTKQLDFLN